jgi:uncharacterized protein YdeI (YjbR/CyaY-like superfamily)
MEDVGGLPVLFFATQSDWENWLDTHHRESKGVWLKIAKKDSRIISLSYAEALDEALCYGWIDGQKKSFDQEAWLQRFTPRSPKSKWSKVNVDKVIKLIASGEMQPAGMEEVNTSKEDGRWDAAYESQRNFTIPDDFQAELDRNQRAKLFFESLNRQNQYAICYRIQTAKKKETRRARIHKYIEMLNNNQRLYP